MKELKQVGAIIATLIAGVFLWFLGAVFMTGVRLDNFGDIAVFVAWNGFVLVVVVVAIRQILSKDARKD